MTTTSVNSVTSSLAQTSETPTGNGTDALGQDVFLKLLVTQMSNQNPLDPQDNTEFVAQLAQFSSVEGLDKLNSNFESLTTSFQSSQALQATSLVGREVRVLSDSAILGASNYLGGQVDVPIKLDKLTMNVYDENNLLVNSEVMTNVEAGEMQFAWDGTGFNGTRLNPGKYTFEMIAEKDNASEQLSTYMNSNVDSVTVGAAGQVMLNVAGIGEVSVYNVKQIL